MTIKKLDEIKALLLEERKNPVLPFSCHPDAVKQLIEVKGVHLKSSNTTKSVRKSAKRVVHGKPTVWDLRNANRRRRVPNTKRNRDIIVQDLVNKGYTRVEAKTRVLKSVKVINGKSYLFNQRSALDKRTLHKDLFTLPTRPGIFFRRPPAGFDLYATVCVPKSVHSASEVDMAFSIRPEEKDQSKIKLQINKERKPLTVLKKDGSTEIFDIDKALKEGIALFSPNGVGGFDLVNNEGVPDYSLDKILLDPKYSKDKVVIPNIPPVPLTEEEKKEWKIFNLGSLRREMPTADSLQYDWEGLRARLEENGDLKEADFMTYHRETTPADEVSAQAKPDTVQTAMEDDRFLKAWKDCQDLDIPLLKGFDWVEKDFEINIKVDIKGMPEQEQKRLLFVIGGSRLEDPNWLIRHTDLLLEQGFSQSVIDDYCKGKSLISKEASCALPKA